MQDQLLDLILKSEAFPFCLLGRALNRNNDLAQMRPQVRFKTFGFSWKRKNVSGAILLSEKAIQISDASVGDKDDRGIALGTVNRPQRLFAEFAPCF